MGDGELRTTQVGAGQVGLTEVDEVYADDSVAAGSKLCAAEVGVGKAGPVQPDLRLCFEAGLLEVAVR